LLIEIDKCLIDLNDKIEYYESKIKNANDNYKIYLYY
jgi:hypothetical protein